MQHCKVLSVLVHFNLTRYAAQVLEVLQRNIDSNGLSGRGRVHLINWRTWRGKPDLGKHDLVLGADLLYASTLVKVRCRETGSAGVYRSVTGREQARCVG